VEKNEKVTDQNRGAGRRVRRPKDKEQLFQNLVQDEGIFDIYAHLLTFAAALGFSRNRREPFEHSGEPIAWEVFLNAGHESFVNAIAAVRTGDLEILSYDRLADRLAVFEEYANGGLIELEKELRTDRNSLDRIRELMLEAQSQFENQKTPEIERMARDLSW
jgi:dnd system-associated protein 4